MTRTILHIGQPKTGTTSLQYVLARNRKSLLRAQVLYPRLPGWGFAHHALAPYFLGPERVDPYVLRRMGVDSEVVQRRAESAWASVAASVRSLHPDYLVLSSEALFHATSEARMRQLGTLLRSVSDQVELVIYLRNPASYALATLHNQIQVHADFVWPGPRFRRAVIESYEKLEPDRIHVVKYSCDDLYRGDLVDDFLRRVLPGTWPVKRLKKRANVSMSAEAMSVMQAAVLANGANKRRRMTLRQQYFRKVLTRLDQQVSGYRKPRFLPRIEASYMRDCTDLGWLKDAYDVEWPADPVVGRFEYAKVGCGRNQPISELCIFDPDREQRLRSIMRTLAPGVLG